MDAMDYWAIAERDIEIQNPVTDRKLRLLDDYCDIRDGLSVLDIGCGKAWVMRQWAETHDISGIGLEINPHFVRFAREAATRQGDRRTSSSSSRDRRANFKPEPAILRHRALPRRDALRSAGSCRRSSGWRTRCGPAAASSSATSR